MRPLDETIKRWGPQWLQLGMEKLRVLQAPINMKTGATDLERAQMLLALPTEITDMITRMWTDISDQKTVEKVAAKVETKPAAVNGPMKPQEVKK